MSQAAITLIILAVAIVLFVSDKLPMGLVAFMVPVALYFTGIIEADDIFSCVINSNVILILGMCVIGAAFFKTGMAYKTSQFLLRYTKSERGLILVITLLSGIMSGFVSNSGTVAVLLPIVLGIAVSSNIKPIKLLLPLVIGATIGADVTIIGSPGNLIAKNTIEEFSNGKMTVSFFEYAKIGIPMLIVVAAFLAMFGPKLINDRDAGDTTEDVSVGLHHEDVHRHTQHVPHALRTQREHAGGTASDGALHRLCEARLSGSAKPCDFHPQRAQQQAGVL